MKYLVTVVQGVRVEADTPEEAEAHGLALCDGGFAETIGVEVEQLGTGVEPLGERKPEQ